MENSQLDDQEDPNQETTPSEPIQIIRPVIQYNILLSLSKTGVYFIDPNTGEYIDGLLNLPSIGLTLTPPPLTNTLNNQALGFANLKNVTSKKTDPTTFELDAILYFEYSDNEFATGYLEKQDAFLYYIKIWNDVDMRIWLDIIEKIVSEFNEGKKDKNLPGINFYVSSAFVPKNTNEPSKLVLTKQYPGTSGMARAVSSLELYSEDDNDTQERCKFPHPYL